jgi:site-specific recombinase XerD
VLENLEALGKEQTTRKTYKKLLLRLASKTDLNEPNQVNLAIARFKKFNPQTGKDTNKDVTNAYKDRLISAYKTYVEYYNIQNWKQPYYTPEDKGIQPPNDEKVKFLIATAKEPLNIKIMIIGETGLRPKEVTGTNGLQVNDIHKDTKTLTARSLKGCNPRPPMPISDELLTALNNYITKHNLKGTDLLFAGNSETLSNHFYDHKKLLAKRLNDPTIEQTRLYDIRHYYITKKVRKLQNTEIVRQITGHKRLNTLQRYIHLALNQTGEWIVEQTNDKQRAKELLIQDFTYQFTTPDGYMTFRKPK